MYTYPNVPRCQHIKTNGTRCGSPALRHQTLCFFHQRWQQQRISIPRHYPGYETSIELPVLEDANSIQMALTQVMRLILLQKVSTKEAGLLLYALQIASANLKRTQFEPHDERNVVIDPAALATAGVGVNSWKPADFPNPLPADLTPEATFTPDPSQPVFYDGQKPAPTPDGTLIPELKAEAEDLAWEGTPLKACPERSRRVPQTIVKQPALAAAVCPRLRLLSSRERMAHGDKNNGKHHR